MNIIIPFASKDQIGDALVEAGLLEAATFFHKKHYAGEKDNIDISLPLEITEKLLQSLFDIGEKLDLRTLKVQMKQALLLINDIENQVVTSLRSFETALAVTLKNNAIKGWVFLQHLTGEHTPYIVTSIDYSPADPRVPREARVLMRIEASTPRATRSTDSKVIDFNLSDVKGNTIYQSLAYKMLFKETEELISAHLDACERYFLYQPQFGKQFVGTGYASEEGGYGGSKIKLDGPKRLKMVNDEKSQSKAVVRKTYNEYDFWLNKGVKLGSGVFEECPFHPYIFMFDLASHSHLWVMADKLSPYQYDPSLGKKLILPNEQRDLIDILVNDMDVVVQDIVEGKSGGTSILCMGAPGLGKTLTAEVYSEIVGRPLYRVHSGQLGTSPNSIEKQLTMILERAENWGAILLIDEADVYIRKRDNSMDHNAIVAAFLRKLEYFSGLLFMTTNRSEDVDDAIKSRCMAIIKYQSPDKDSAIQIWKTLSTQFEMDMTDKVINALFENYPSCSGRDIKELLKLAKKFNTNKGFPLDLETFRQCAIFRGIEHR